MYSLVLEKANSAPPIEQDAILTHPPFNPYNAYLNPFPLYPSIYL